MGRDDRFNPPVVFTLCIRHEQTDKGADAELILYYYEEVDVQKNHVTYRTNLYFF